ncbi:beta-ketoacyl synthase N-terminal-like domain-containing protein [Streptomyces hygroscopicus]|uniref:beta-ketoacyl synthase N-terminal-like domain-containing protein n=1 Tax=Streptomyces hygroscopicus TaxID=1912 RepID=UPI0033EE7F9B
MADTLGGWVISEMAVASPYGLGEDAFAEGVLAGRRAAAPLDAGAWPAPYTEAGLIPGFDVVKALGPKGTRSMDRLTGIVVTTTGLLLERCGTAVADAAKETGLVLGTPGSVQSVMAFTHDALSGERPFNVNPAHFPNTVLNHPAGRSAIWHGLKGPNVSVSGGAASGLHALNYASRLLRGGHADTVMCGAAEEFSVQRARLEHVHTEGAGAPLGEGAAFFLLESVRSAQRGGRTPRAELLGCRFRVFTRPELAGKALVTCVTDLLQETGTDAEEIGAVAPTGAPGFPGEQEATALEEVLGPRGTDGRARLELHDLLGGTGAASAALQFAGLLTLAAHAPWGTRRLALVTAVDGEGIAACALFRSATADGNGPR